MFIINDNPLGTPPEKVGYSVMQSTSTILSNAVLYDQVITEISTSAPVTVIVSGIGSAPNVPPSGGIVILSNTLTSSSHAPPSNNKCVYVYHSHDSRWAVLSSGCKHDPTVCKRELPTIQKDYPNALNGQTLLVDCVRFGNSQKTGSGCGLAAWWQKLKKWLRICPPK